MNRPLLYLGLMALEALLAWFAVSRAGEGGARRMIGGEWHGVRDVLRDVAIAAALWATLLLVERALTALHPARGSVAISAMTPRTTLEALLWIPLSISAGVAEELAFRGWLQRLLLRKTSSAFVAVVGQASIFGAFHAYQDVEHAARIVVIGLLFGIVAHWRRSLRPGMIAHAWTDLAAGLLGI